MKEKYLSPMILNSNLAELSTTKNGLGVLPVLEAITAAASAGYVLGKSLKKVFGMTDIGEKFSTLTARKNFELI